MTNITLEDLRPAEGATGKSKRVGRGRSSGHGKTSCRGHNGEGQRSGNSSKRGFEGGQMPLYRQLPKHGFKNPFAKTYAVVNLDTIQKAIDAGKLDAKNINVESLLNSNVVSKQLDGIRLLARGAVTSSINITVDSASKSAVEAVEKAGGKVSFVAAK